MRSRDLRLGEDPELEISICWEGLFVLKQESWKHALTTISEGMEEIVEGTGSPCQSSLLFKFVTRFRHKVRMRRPCSSEPNNTKERHNLQTVTSLTGFASTGGIHLTCFALAIRNIKRDRIEKLLYLSSRA